ncbi:MAG: hypothetical protein UR98_C0017G0007 [Parcubacteria group bacterium GW2011_GWA1_36_12]|uniref:Uncharacterized protein n=1 Tax=Candidatus Curtissbacteria bacterium RIFCSPLOWO2_01_FULL_42_26 TaxID=1797729 RepID=A0A1F5HXZ9_9BACT|nr:MAG: hypothetical protein UR98_C0017G0007 [Parcubacteria group bacterium GW2011_GWA1_36_12]OGE09062.1 MAG: hypothetical protein A3A60_02810 [Candidatus Curtissbacteria bacterium RIFCSPLOWO2_01_FULL_42_26]
MLQERIVNTAARAINHLEPTAAIIPKDSDLAEKLIVGGVLLAVVGFAFLNASRASEGTVYRRHEKLVAWGIFAVVTAINVLANYEIWSK